MPKSRGDLVALKATVDRTGEVVRGYRRRQRPCLRLGCVLASQTGRVVESTGDQGRRPTGRKVIRDSEAGCSPGGVWAVYADLGATGRQGGGILGMGSARTEWGIRDERG